MQTPVVDLHEDVSSYYLSHGWGLGIAGFNVDLEGREADIPKYLKGNVRLVFASVFPGITTFEPEKSAKLEKLYGRWIPTLTFRTPQTMVFEHLKVYYKLVEVYKELELIEDVESVERVFRNGKIGFLLHLEGAEALDSPEDLKILYRLGIRSIGLTWNYNNKYGCGCMSAKDYGLTPEGEELIKEANRLGIVLDLAHASKNTVVETIRASKKPVVISHTNLAKFVNSPRNVDDEVLEELYNSKGVVGISAITPLIRQGGRANIDDLVKNYTYVYERFGGEILAIGTDFLGLAGIPPPEGFESIDKVRVLLEKLKDSGVKDSDIEKIAYANVLRVLVESIE